MTDSDSVSRRNFLRATGATAAAGAIAGCTDGGSENTEGTPTATDEGTESSGGEGGKELNLINSTATTLDPISATGTASGRVIQQIFDSLMVYANATTTVESRLASEYEVSEDFTTYTFTLNEATFHNGDSVTASDVVYSLERLAQSSNSSRAYFILSSLGVIHETDSDGNYVPDSLDIQAVDESTVEINLSGAFHASLEMLAYSSFAIVPEGIVGDIEGYDGELSYEEFSSSNPVGAGPFQLDDWSQGTEMSVVKYEDYYGESAALDRVHWQVLEKDSPRYNYAMNRNADMFGIPTSFYEPDKVSVDETDAQGRQIGTYGEVRNGDTVNYVGVPTINTYYIGFNMEAVPKPVRQAMAYAMNQQTMVQEVFKGRGEPAYHLTPPSTYPGGATEYTNHAEESYPYGYNESQLDKAREVMEEAGYGPDNRYTLGWTQYQSGTWKSMATLLRDQLASAHIDMEIEEAPFSTMLERGRKGNLEAYTLGWIADWPAPDNFVQLLNPPQTDTSNSSPVSYINWSSETGSAAQTAADAYTTIEENQAPTDSAESARADAYVEMEEANWEDVGFINVYHSVSEMFWYDTVENYTPFGGMGFSRQKLTDVTVNE